MRGRHVQDSRQRERDRPDRSHRVAKPRPRAGGYIGALEGDNPQVSIDGDAKGRRGVADKRHRNWGLQPLHLL